MKTEQFLLKTVKSRLYPQLNMEELDHKAKEELASLRIREALLGVSGIRDNWQNNFGDKGYLTQ